MKSWNRIKVGGAAIALGICTSAMLYQPTIVRSEEGDAGDRPQPNPTEHKFGGPTNQKFGNQNNGGGQPGGPGGGHRPMRPEQMMEELDLTPQQQARVQAIYEQEREQMRAIHEKTRASIMGLLTAEQKTKFSQMPQSGPRGQGPRGNGPRGQQGNGASGNGGRPGGQNGGAGGGNHPAQGEMHDEDRGRPVELIAKDLGVTPEQFREAFKKVRPAPRGQRPTEEQLHSNHQILAKELGVSIEKLDAVMDKYRPEGPDRRPQE